ncbi:transglycosylase domain-containing protein [Corynebacterium durum]|uniref:transglycosylase domain-containing protein n=1 Tax=Corynebacterium durum TaxID=61592 RepID=UPI0028890282|nr:transglycosylase domain-containing protein [Corynebacterium durum]
MTAYVLVDVPEPDQLVSKQVSNIYAADGSTEIARIVPPEGNRVQVNIDQIPPSLQSAVVAAEDREFYTNRGFSLSGFARAALGQLTGDSTAGGGSTITQQYVKNAVVGDERSYTRKLKELVFSAKMANEWSKEEVLSAYLNTIYFGRNSYGVAAAAKAYFNKPLEELTPAESAVLAASIQRPSQLDPWNNREEAEQRWNYVLDGMVSTGSISQQERATMTYPEVQDPALNTAYTEANGPNGLIKNQVIAELETLGISEDDVQTRGLRVTTSIDPTAQDAAVKSVENLMQGEGEKLRTAVVSVDPNNGEVKAYYGGTDANGWDYANSALQTGSTFKVFGLAAALQQGIPLSAMYDSSPVTTGNVTVSNVGGQGCGVCSIQEALKLSLNTSFIRLSRDLEHGPQDVADMAHALGVAESLPGIPQTLTENGQPPFDGIILGQYQSRPLDMAVGLATLANEGVWHKPHFVNKVETSTGQVLYEHDAGEGERRVDSAVANNVIAAMQPIAAYSNGHGLAGGRVSAAKTGTTQLGDTGTNKDAWMIGATPQLATAVWVGNDDNSALYNASGGSMYGSGLPADIWKSTMDKALVNAPNETFPQASGLGYNTSPSTSYPQTPQTSQAPTPSTQQSPYPDSNNQGNQNGDIVLAPGIVIPGDLLNPPDMPAPVVPNNQQFQPQQQQQQLQQQQQQLQQQLQP